MENILFLGVPILTGKHIRVVEISVYISVDNVLKDLSKGTRMNKVKGGGILYTRDFFLDTDSMKLLYTGSQKKFRKKNTSCM